MRKFNPNGVLALRPDAFGMGYPTVEDRSNVYTGEVAVVSVSGPLIAERDDGYFDSYADLRLRFAEACLSPAKRIVLRVNSPGGMVHNAFSTARDLRAMAAAAGKEFIGYCDEMAYSAGFALLSGATKTVISETGGAGSIGCIKSRIDISKMNERDGIGVTFITSGRKKAFGHPDLAVSAEEISDEQREVDQYGDMFCQLVSAHRGLSVEHVKGFEAGTFVGAGAVQAQLIDEVGRLEDLFVIHPNTAEVHQVTLTEIMQALSALAEGDGEDKDQAAKLLAAAAAGDEPSEEDEPKAGDPDEDEPSGDEPKEGEDDEDEDEPKPAADATAALKAEVEALKAEVSKLAAIKSRKPVVTTVASKKNTPAPVKSKLDLDLDRGFGLDKSSAPSVTREGNAIVFR